MDREFGVNSDGTYEAPLPDDLVVTSTTDGEDAIRTAYGMEEAKPAAEGEAATDDGAEGAPAAAAAVEGDAEVVDDPAKSSAPKKKETWVERNKRLQAETDKITRARSDEERRLTDLRAEIARLEAQRSPAAAKPEPAAGPKARPRLEAFPSVDEYEKALDQWETDREATVKETASQAALQALNARAAVAAHQEAVDAYNKQCTEAETKYPDFAEVMTASSDVPISGLMNQAILELAREKQIGADIVYYLASHPEESKTLAEETIGLVADTATPDQIRKAINVVRRQLETLVSSTPRTAAPAPKTGPAAAPRRKVAPPPLGPVTGGAPASTPNVFSPDVPIDDYIEARNREEFAGRL